MDFWVLFLGSAVGAAVVSGIFGFVKNHQDKNNEHAQWLRNQKIDVYTNLLRQVHISVNNLKARERGEKPEKKALKDITDVSNARLMVVGSSEVRGLAIYHIDNLNKAYAALNTEAYDAAWNSATTSGMHLENAIRKDLDVIEKQALRHTVRSWFYKYLVYPWRDPFEKRYFRTHGYAWTERKLRHPRHLNRFLKRAKRKQRQQDRHAAQMARWNQ